MTEKELRIEKLRDELTDFMDEMTEENFDAQRLDAILKELEELDPTPPGTFKSVDESWKEFRETYAHLFEAAETQAPEATNDGMQKNGTERNKVCRFVNDVLHRRESGKDLSGRAPVEGSHETPENSV